MADSDGFGDRPWRVGRKVGRTVYDAHDRLIGVMDTPILAALVVLGVNALDQPAAWNMARSTCNHSMTTKYPDGMVRCLTCPAQRDEPPSRPRRITPSVSLDKPTQRLRHSRAVPPLCLRQATHAQRAGGFCRSLGGKRWLGPEPTSKPTCSASALMPAQPAPSTTTSATKSTTTAWTISSPSGTAPPSSAHDHDQEAPTQGAPVPRSPLVHPLRHRRHHRRHRRMGDLERPASPVSKDMGWAHKQRRAQMPPPTGQLCPCTGCAKHRGRCRTRMWPNNTDADHPHPRILGGTDSPLRWMCSPCNRSRGATLGNKLRGARKAAAAKAVPRSPRPSRDW